MSEKIQRGSEEGCGLYLYAEGTDCNGDMIYSCKLHGIEGAENDGEQSQKKNG